ncbi:MAG: peptidylprolyl isomerase [Gammaproteobacteria bacterium]|nr:peptidylprolyl isomerase [Gammaproteobacteria bacterium]
MIKMTTNFGTITLELDHDKAPVTAANFEQYVKDGFYDGTIFHRVINGFMIQGGGMLPGMIEKQPREQIKNEADNGLKNDRGTIAMARTNEPHSASSQFFINVSDNAFLNHRAPSGDGWGYCVFGRVVDGMEVVDQIKGVQTGNAGYHQDVPVEDVIIESVVLEEGK